ncbi:sulfatase-like hydrolase/transferase [Cerasicoccus fimbriatus]|uniref:sulfatase-like hydrolase/transferase n=1 Tax=Cerasicoccus fimbriatus TaxID=3014554 RepID=UPI0022B2E59F|nr:sulfatase-like hydrolase/transferase [Cerasicoccus sp. TK19100]
MSQAKRPNILFLMSDEHRADVAGFAGNDVVRTPILDHLAETGVVFNNAYTPSPICIPGRQCMMSGQLPHTCHCYNFGEDLTPNYMTFSRRFSQYAYHTVCSGKLHHSGPDQMQGWTRRIAPDTHLGLQYIDGAIPEEFARYQPAPGVGKWSNQRELEEARPAFGVCQRLDRDTVNAAFDYLSEHFHDPLYCRSKNHRPLLFKLSLVQPHYPYFTDEDRFRYYYERAPIFDEKPCDHPVLSLSQLNKPVNVSTDTIRRATAAYYGMVDQVDNYYGQVLNHLELLGEDLDDWIIVYTSDHGEMLGEHGIWEKARFYEASARVPLIIRWPKGFEGGRVVNENVNLCDLFATLCDLSGLEIPSGLDSRSLAPLLRGESVDWCNESVSQIGPSHVMIKQDALKYQYYGEDVPEVLFDLEADPGELKNFANDPAYASAMARFRQRLGELGNGLNADPNYVNAGYA